MVGRTRCGAWLTIRKSERGGGSSITLSSAFALEMVRSSALSTMQTRYPPSAAVEPNMVSARRTASTGIVAEAAFLSVGGDRLRTARLGWDRAAT
jgi:hypothetical protein